MISSETQQTIQHNRDTDPVFIFIFKYIYVLILNLKDTDGSLEFLQTVRCNRICKIHRWNISIGVSFHLQDQCSKVPTCCGMQVSQLIKKYMYGCLVQNIKHHNKFSLYYFQMIVVREAFRKRLNIYKVRLFYSLLFLFVSQIPSNSRDVSCHPISATLLKVVTQIAFLS